MSKLVTPVNVYVYGGRQRDVFLGAVYDQRARGGGFDAIGFTAGRVWEAFARRIPTLGEAVRLLHVHLLMNDPRYDGSLERDYPELFE